MKNEYRIFIWLFSIVFCLFYYYLFIVSGTYLLRHEPKAMDFIAFYTGAKLLSQSPADLYNLHWQQIVQVNIDPASKINHVFLPFLNPPFVAFLFQIMLPFTLVNAYNIVLGVNIVLLMLIFVIFKQLNKYLPWYIIGAFIIGATTFVPIMISLLVGQTSIFLCVIFLLSWFFLKKGWEFRGGLMLSLILIKPHFFILPLFAILIQRRITILAGIVMGAVCLLGISYFLVGWNSMNNYFALLRVFYDTGTGYNINLSAQQSIQTLLLIMFHTQNLDQIRFYWIIGILSIIIPTLFIWSKKLPYTSREFALQFALLIIATLLTSPHTHFYDVSLLLVVIVLVFSQMKKLEQKKRKVFSGLIILSYFIPLFGYFLFNLQQDSMQGLWVIPTVVFLIIFWLLLVKDLFSVKGNSVN